MSGLYSADYSSAFYDGYGLKEWNRLTSTPPDQVNLHITSRPTPKHNNGHPMKRYRYRDLRSLLERHGAEVVAASAAKLLSAGRLEALEPFLDTSFWNNILDWELGHFSEEAAPDGGTHSLAVAEQGSL